ncbi:MAG TPA: AMP-binding protein, partial [Blastocatellia bacterium]|nr:AMP-binding protein [Blastocatellia bacterium]
MQMKPGISLIADMIRYQASVRPGNVATVFENRETTFAELDQRSSQVANGLSAEGLGPQARVAVLDKNSDVFFEIMFGAAKARDVMIGVNWRLSPSEAAYVIRDATAEILFVGQDFIPVVEQVLGELGAVKKI